VTFIGAIITVSGANERHHTKPREPRQVIDGQQRLTTILMVAVAAHEHLGRLIEGLSAGVSIDSSTFEWCHEQVTEVRGQLFSCMADLRNFGDEGFRGLPKITRDIADCWSNRREHARYVSPIAHILHSYVSVPENGKFEPQAPSGVASVDVPGSSPADHEFVYKRFGQIRKLIRDVAAGTEGDLAESIDLNHVLGPQSKALAGLFQSDDADLAPNLRAAAASSADFASVLRLLLFSRFMLERVALTQINAKDESYAFDLFDSLNTTGEPLTAFETFVPLVVEKEGLDKYPSSSSFEHISLTSSLISADDGNVQRQTARLVTSFFLADAGLKVPAKHNEQRRELTKRYREAETLTQCRAMTRQLADTSLCYFRLWENLELSRGLTGVDHGLDAESLFALRFLNHVKHTVVLAPLSRYYSAWRETPSIGTLSALQSAIKGSTAFSVLWRAAHGGTDGIDGEYRKVMVEGVSGVCNPLSRTNPNGHDVRDLPPVADLLSAYRSLLKGARKFGFSDSSGWIDLAAKRAIYDEQYELSRFLLLVAAHHAIPDADTGLTKDGQTADHTDMLRADRYTADDRLSTVEHVAPRTPTSGEWPDGIYEQPSAVSQLGNLTLLPLDRNAFLSNRSWQHKRILYRALSADAPDESNKILDDGLANGLELTSDKRDYIVQQRQHLPILQAVANYGGGWNREFIERRTRHLLGRAWGVLDSWLDV
jgi:hypothetical protein